MRQNLRSWTCLHLTPKLARACYFSLLQPYPKTSPFLLFLPRTDGRICWNFQISPRQRQKALRCLFVEFQHIQSSDSEHFQKEFQFRSRDSSWVIERESEEPNGSKIERGWHNLNSIPGMKRLFWDEVDRPFLGSAMKAGKREGWHPTVLVRGQQAKRKGVVSLSRIMERLRHQPFTKVGCFREFKGFVWSRGFNLGGAGSLLADETHAPEVIAGPHLLTSSQLSSKRAWKAIRLPCLKRKGCRFEENCKVIRQHGGEQLWQRCLFGAEQREIRAHSSPLVSPFCLPCGAPNLHQSAAWCSAPPSRTETPSARQCASGSPGAAPPASSSSSPSAWSPALGETPQPAYRPAVTLVYFQELFWSPFFSMST